MISIVWSLLDSSDQHLKRRLLLPDSAVSSRESTVPEGTISPQLVQLHWTKYVYTHFFVLYIILCKWFHIAFSNIFSVIYLSFVLTSFLLLIKFPLFSNFLLSITGILIFLSLAFLFLPSHSPLSSLFTFLVSVITPGYGLQPKDLVLQTADEREHVVLSFWVRVTSSNIFSSFVELS